ncbi:MAG: chloride channel protein [Candidatus Pelagadaptatus aseana]|uniref:chloride channel protein n=1 Tax=Candidatus Pelagadaptatus aseana TaxID=3120508 RepID=UPI0039B265B5
MPKTPKPTDEKHPRYSNLLDNFRHQLAHLDALPQLTILGLISGLAAAAVIVAFRLLIDGPLQVLLEGHSENFESLPSHWRFALPVAGSLALAALVLSFKPEHRQVSVGHVIERLNNHQGKLPAGNWILQFFGGALALISGQSMGREGPAVHLGAGIASQLGQWFKLPNNSLRTLVGCGIASAIAASFNTPMAGVIFAMEVVLMEYTIAGFVPVMMASVTGAIVVQYVFGPEQAFNITLPSLNTLDELTIIIAAGIVIAYFAALVIRTQLWFNSKKHWPLTLRFLAAGVTTGSLALFVPQIMGVGYDTIEAAMAGQIGFSLLLAILFAKILATCVSTGFGLPGGVIGPMLFIGATLGGCIGIVAQLLLPDSASSPGFYVMLGMAAMMASVINAPLAALITVLELTYNPHIIFPTMLIIVVSVVATRQLFQCQGIFMAQLETNGFRLTGGLIRQTLNRVGVRSVMDINFQFCHAHPSFEQLEKVLLQNPKWLVITDEQQERQLLLASDISVYLASRDDWPADEAIDLLKTPSRKWQIKPISQQASLYDAQKQLRELKADALYVERGDNSLLPPVLGIITQEKIDGYYQQ